MNRKNSNSPPFNWHLWEYTPVQDMMGIGLIVGLLWLGFILRDLLTPVLLGFFLAYLCRPLIDYALNKWGLPQLASISFLLVVLIALVGGLGALLAPVLIEQIVTLAHKMPGYLGSLMDRYDIRANSLTTHVSDLTEQIQQDPVSALRMVFRGTNQAVSVMGIIMNTTTYFIISFVLVPMYFFFFAWYFPAINNQVKEYIPASRKDKILRILRKMDDTIAMFFRGRLLMAVIMGVLFSVGWWFTNVPYWFLLGLGTGLLSLIPYAATVGWPVAVLLKYLDMISGQGSLEIDWMAVILWPSVVYIVVQVFEGWVLTPWIQSESTNLSAGTILLAVLIGGTLAGIYGLLLAIPLTACSKIFLQEIVLPRLKQWAMAN